MPTDADSPALNAFLRWTEGRFGGPVRFADPPRRSLEGFDNDIWFATLSGDVLPAEWRGPLVLRAQPSADRHELAEREADVYRFLSGLGYPVPRILAVVPPDGVVLPPIQVMERAPGRTMLKAMTRSPWRLNALVDALAGLHARLHTLPTEGWPFPDERESGRAVPAERRLSLVYRVVSEPGSLGQAALADALRKVEPLVAKLAVDDPRVVHGDLHPLNVLADGDRVHVVDWTDSSLGDPYADISRVLLLFEAVAVAAPKPIPRRVLGFVAPRIRRRFVATYTARTGTALDERRLALWEPVQRLHDWARAAVTLASEERAGNMRPEALGWIRDTCLRAIDATAA